MYSLAPLSETVVRSSITRLFHTWAIVVAAVASLLRWPGSPKRGENVSVHAQPATCMCSQLISPVWCDARCSFGQPEFACPVVRLPSRAPQVQLLCPSAGGGLQRRAAHSARQSVAQFFAPACSSALYGAGELLDELVLAWIEAHAGSGAGRSLNSTPTSHASHVSHTLFFFSCACGSSGCSRLTGQDCWFDICVFSRTISFHLTCHVLHLD